MVDQGVEMAELDQGQAVTSTPKRGILKNANSNGGQHLGDPTPSQQSTPRRSQATLAQGGAGPTIKVEPEHHFQRCRNEGLGGDFSSKGLHITVVHTSWLWRSVPWRYLSCLGSLLPL